MGRWALLAPLERCQNSKRVSAGPAFTARNLSSRHRSQMGPGLCCRARLLAEASVAAAPRAPCAHRRRVPMGMPARPDPHAGSRVSAAASDSSPSICFRGKVSVAHFLHSYTEGACVSSAGRDPSTEQGATPGGLEKGEERRAFKCIIHCQMVKFTVLEGTALRAVTNVSICVTAAPSRTRLHCAPTCAA